MGAMITWLSSERSRSFPLYERWLDALLLLAYPIYDDDHT